MTELKQRAFTVELPFEFFLYNDEEDMMWYFSWEAAKQPWIDDMPQVTDFLYEGQRCEYKVYTGDVDKWFKEKDGYDTEGRYADGEVGWTLIFTVIVRERAPVE